MFSKTYPIKDYHPTNHRPSKAEPNLVAQISKLGTISKCLEEALSDMISEDATTTDKSSGGLIATKDNGITDKGSIACRNSNTRVTTIAQGEDETSACPPGLPVVCEDFKTKLVRKYGEAIADIEWDDQGVEDTSSATENDEITVNRHTRSSSDSSTDTLPPSKKLKRGCSSVYPPAALLRGKLEYYNRIGGQWRIVVSHGEIRRRVNFNNEKKEEMKKKNDKNEISLWEQSNRRGNDTHDVIKFDDPIQILAYDDV